jgi:hypothetical protein
MGWYNVIESSNYDFAEQILIDYPMIKKYPHYMVAVKGAFSNQTYTYLYVKINNIVDFYKLVRQDVILTKDSGILENKKLRLEIYDTCRE